MDSTGIEDPRKPVTEEATIAGAVSLETMHHDNSPLVTTGDIDEATSDVGASPIKQALYLVQVIFLVFAGIIALLFTLFNIAAFAVPVVAFFGYSGLFWYNIASSGRTREKCKSISYQLILNCCCTGSVFTISY